MNTGIYEIYNTVTKKRYIGSTTRDFKKRWGGHRHRLRKNKHHSKHLQNTWNKYGEDNFEFRIIEFCKPEHCIQREQWWMDLYGVADRNYGYNLACFAGNTVGHTVSEELKNKLRNLKKGNKYALGRKRSDETKQKIRLAKLGTKHSEEYCRKRSLMFKGENNPNYGKTHTEETRRKISERLKGNINCKGRILSDESKIKMRNSRSVYVYVITTPSNEEIITNSLREFCKSNKLDRSSFQEILKGIKNNYKGYSIKRFNKEEYQNGTDQKSN